MVIGEFYLSPVKEKVHSSNKCHCTKDNSGGVPIQISVYIDKIIIWNDGQLPASWNDKIIRECKQANIPEPIFNDNSSDISIEFRKDIYNEKYLQSLNLNERQVKAVLFVKNKRKITNNECQTLNDCSRSNWRAKKY